ncbi:STE24 endopeptidase [Enteropsectra breve]|nr:STE24 endopeptidase [Enteropsectra breve]
MNKGLISKILAANAVFDIFLLSRQIMAQSRPLSKDASKIVSEKEHRHAANYCKWRKAFGIFEVLFSLLRNLLVVFYASDCYHKYFEKLPQAAQFFVIANIAFANITSIPLDLFSDFVIEHKFGFNKKSLGTFVKDIFVSFGVCSVIAYLLLTPALSIISRFASFYIYLWVFIVAAQIVIVFIYPKLIAPLYNKFTPLEDGPLKTDIEALAKKIGFSIGKIFVADGSKRSGHSNAYFTGFGKSKQIVFYDTILKQLNNREILAVLAHEFGHWSHSHLPLSIVFSSVICFGYCYAFNIFLSQASKEPLILRLFECSNYIGVASLLVNLVQNLFVRRNEKQADRYAVSLNYGDDLKSALIKINNENKITLLVDRLYSIINFSHPPLLERLELIDSELKKQK